MSEITSASPAAKRARLAESRASNVLALQTYRIRVTLPLAMGKYGKRVFDVHQEATFDELHEAICTSFNRGLGYHLCQFRYPIDSYFARPTGMKKADLLEWCLAFGVPTEGLKVPEMKSRLSAISKRLEDEQRQRYREWEFNGDAAPGSKKLKSFVVEDETHGYGVSEGFENKHVGSQKTKLSDVMLAKGDLLEYIWERAAHLRPGGRGGDAQQLDHRTGTERRARRGVPPRQREREGVLNTTRRRRVEPIHVDDIFRHRVRTPCKIYIHGVYARLSSRVS